MDNVPMEQFKIPNECGIDDLWDLANLAFELEKCNENDKKELVSYNGCKHKNYHLNEEGFMVCEDCGIVIGNSITNEAEWNNYKDESGNYQKNTQRADVWVDDNPYSQGISSTTIPWHPKSFIARLHMQQTFTHKQKTYWLISQLIDNISSILNIPSNVANDAKRYWYKYMESGKLTRASVRKGLICACLIQACHVNKLPIARDAILTLSHCSSKSLSKGEKILFEILDEKNQIYINVLDDDSQYFIKYCNLLSLPFSVNDICNKIYNKYKISLQAVSPKSAVGGVIAYVIKYKLKLKNPTKTIISATVDVCTPTLNKVINLIYYLDKDNLD